VDIRSFSVPGLRRSAPGPSAALHTNAPAPSVELRTAAQIRTCTIYLTAYMRTGPSVPLRTFAPCFLLCCVPRTSSFCFAANPRTVTLALLRTSALALWITCGPLNRDKLTSFNVQQIVRFTDLIMRLRDHDLSIDSPSISP